MVIASVAFRNFKALRQAQVRLEPFNLVIGPNGSGKTSLIEAMLRLRALIRLPLATPPGDGDRPPGGAEVSFRFRPPFDGWEALLLCASEDRCEFVQAIPLPTGEGVEAWPQLQAKLQRIRRYEFNHHVLSRPAAVRPGAELAADGANLAAVLAVRQAEDPGGFAAWREDVLRALPEYDRIDVETDAGGLARLRLRLAGEDQPLHGDDLSQGSLYALALFALAYDPQPPSVVCIEELDRGLHPRLLRDVRDALYRLCHPESCGLAREAVQVVATTHSPYLLDLFRDHPEEVVIADKRGREARFSRLSDVADLAEMMSGASLGDLWFSGILGGVPDAAHEARHP